MTFTCKLCKDQFDNPTEMANHAFNNHVRPFREEPPEDNFWTKVTFPPAHPDIKPKPDANFNHIQSVVEMTINKFWPNVCPTCEQDITNSKPSDAELIQFAREISEKE